MYLAPIMPRQSYELLQAQITKAIDALEGRRSLPDLLDVPVLYRACVVDILRGWQHDALEEYGTHDVRE